MPIGGSLGSKVQPQVRAILEQLLAHANGLGNASTAIFGTNYRWAEGPYPSSSSGICTLLQFRGQFDWQTIAAFGADGTRVDVQAIPVNTPSAITAAANWTVTAVDLRKDSFGRVTFSAFLTPSVGATTTFATLSPAFAAKASVVVLPAIISATGAPATAAGFNIQGATCVSNGFTLTTAYVVSGCWQASP